MVCMYVCKLNIPFAEMLAMVTCTVSINDDGLLRTSTGCTIPKSSLTL